MSKPQTDPPDADLPAGYEPIAMLARRGDVRVLRARRRGDAGEEVVLRIEPRADEEGGEGGESAAELAVLAAVDHPGLARLVDFGALPGGGRYVARRWVEGEDLEHWIRGRSPEEVARVAAATADALEHLHRAGFVHGDLKAENVLVRPDGEPVLCDYGLARAADEPGAPNAPNAPGGVAGTLYAIAPEVLLGAPPGPPADLFALGAMLHRLFVGARASARDFYARFPARTFFDAAESPPELLPELARDVVAALVARDPARRPASAGAVARTLRARLGGTAPAARAGEAPRVPFELGRERWLVDLHAAVSSDSALNGHLWVRLVPGEPAERLATALRLFVALRGTPTTGLAIDAEAARASDPVALDRWARGRAAELAGVVVASLAQADAWSARAAELLVRALRQRGRSAARLVVVAADGPPDAVAAGFEPWELPPVEPERFQAFLVRALPREAPERRAAFGAALLDAAGGAAARLEALLLRAAREGRLLPEGDAGWSLRPGPPPSAADLADAVSAAELSALPDGARAALAALHVAGGRLAGRELAAHGADAEAVLALTGAGLATWDAREHTFALARPLADAGALAEGALAALHARRARLLAERGAAPRRVLPHRFAAGEDVGDAIAAELERLSRAGSGELALGLLEHVERCGRDGGRDALREHPRLALARALAWLGLGRQDAAEAALEALDALGRDGGAPGLALLGRARLAADRREAEQALALCDRAADAAPELALDVRLARVQILHELGRHEQTIALADDVADAPPRQRAFARSLAAVSAFRLGRVDEARTELEALLGDAAACGDRVLAGALRIDLATIARRTGDVARAADELRRAVREYESAGHAAGLAHARATLGGVLRDAGEMVAAEPLLAAAADMRERLGDERGANTVRGIHGLLLAERGHARGAIAELERCAERMEGAQRLRFVPLLCAKADEARARIGEPPRAAADDAMDEIGDADPRALVARARAAWMRGDHAAALDAARRAVALARSLGLAPLVAEAGAVVAALDDSAPEPTAAPAGTAAAEDRAILALLDAEPFEAERARALAEELEARGRDDRAARVHLALAARLHDGDAAAGARASAERCLRRTNAGLSASEAETLRLHLLAQPDPWPAELLPRGPDENEDWDMEIVSLLEINRRLVEQTDLTTLLGEIVDAALDVTGAERGFLALAERGELRFDTAHDSRRGDIAQPDFEVSSSVLRDALERMEPLRLSNAVDDPLLGHTPSVVSLELRSILVVPFRVDAEVSGAIYLDHRLRTGAFGDKAERLCALLADQAALAIRQIRRLDEIRALNQRLERRVEDQEEDLLAARRALRDAGIAADDGGLIGGSAVMERTRALIDRAAQSGLVVLVTGESGTGKELAARALHRRSPRATGPFVSENCAALPPTLIESELFGYRRGAFTGAEEDRAGLFERASGGTLFLDEVGEMPVDLQAKLLRVLETGEVRRLGDAQPRGVEVRLVAATNRDLAREVREGRFREDLYYRLDGLRVEMPSLAERAEDVPELIAHFLRLERAKDGRTRRASRAVLERLSRRAWPGNVRELRNEVARLCVLSEGDLDDPDLVREPDTALTGDAPDAAGGAPATLADLERRAIEDALRRTDGDKRKAAELLGISRAKIYQRLKEWRHGEEGESG